jgi:hypothetical protein
LLIKELKKTTRLLLGKFGPLIQALPCPSLLIYIYIYSDDVVVVWLMKREVFFFKSRIGFIVHFHRSRYFFKLFISNQNYIRFYTLTILDYNLLYSTLADSQLQSTLHYNKH